MSGRYNHAQYLEPMRKALCDWANEADRIVSGFANAA